MFVLYTRAKSTRQKINASAASFLRTLNSHCISPVSCLIQEKHMPSFEKHQLCP